MKGKLKLRELLPDSSNSVIHFNYGLKAVNPLGGVFWLCHNGKGQMWHDTSDNKVLMSRKKADRLIANYMEICQFVTIEAVMIPDNTREFEQTYFGKPVLRPYSQICKRLSVLAKVIMGRDWGDYDLQKSRLWGEVTGLLLSLGYRQSEIYNKFDLRDSPREGKVSPKYLKWYIEYIIDGMVWDGDDPNVVMDNYGMIDGILYAFGHTHAFAVAKRTELVEGWQNDSL